MNTIARSLLLSRGCAYSTTRNTEFGYTKSQDFHVSSARPLPCAAPLPLPDNVQDINASEIGRFSPLRNRDITGSVISSHELDDNVRMEKFDITTEADPHIEPYDCRGAVNLSSSMQSNVPQPFKGQHCFFGMPGSQWGQGHKYLLDNLNSSHYLNLRNHYRRNFHTGYSFHKGNEFDLLTKRLLSHDIVRTYCDKVKTDIGKNMSTKEKLKQAVAAYGSTVIVFHVTISLISLGACYLLVSSGVNIAAAVEYLGLSDGALSKKITENAGTFVIAYAVHKVFAPARIAITLTSTPFIVRYLRKIGILKNPTK